MLTRILSEICSYMVRTPDAPALVTPENVVSFGELGARVSAIRRALAGQGGKVQLVLGHKEPDCVAAMIACALEGCPFVFADRSYPVQRINRIARVAQATQALIAGEAPDGLDLAGIVLSGIADSADFAMPVPAKIGDTAIFYIIFTSGSTGEPKGVPISRANYVALHEWYAPLLDETSGGAHVNHSSFAFDMGMFDLWPTLSLGRPVILLSHRNNIIPRNNILHLLNSSQAAPGSWASTPSLLQLMCTDARFDHRSFPGLRFFVVGGEMLPRPLIREMLKRFPQARIFNGYGPSEATCCTHLRLLDISDCEGEKPLSVGPAVGLSQMRIIDIDGSDVAPGEAGEVELTGPQVVQAYIPAEHPANTAFGWRDGQRSYRTGDLGRIDADGALVLMGRIDRQVKWLGNRIELDEIERVADEFPAVSKSACVPQKENGRVTGIVLFVQPKPGATIGREALFGHLGRFLPAAVIPRDLRFVEVLPVTVNGKLDTRALLETMETA